MSDGDAVALWTFPPFAADAQASSRLRMISQEERQEGSFAASIMNGCYEQSVGPAMLRRNKCHDQRFPDLRSLVLLVRCAR